MAPSDPASGGSALLRSFFVPAEVDGARLDKALELALPGMGLRGRRRLCAEGRVLLSGRPCGPAFKVRAGQFFSLALGAADLAASGPEAAPAPTGALSAPLSFASPPFSEHDRPRLVHAASGLAAVYKPGGLHSAALAGGSDPSLEALLAHLLSGLCAGQPPYPLLLNRLDGPTSGLVLAACEADGESLWRNAEARGEVDKRYLAVAHGWPERDFTADRALATDKRARSRVLPALGVPLRHTEVHVLWTFTGQDAPSLAAHCAEPQARLALLGCRIRKGARHQIRAHLAAAGHPLLGDALYGGGNGGAKGSGKFFLHHGACALPGFNAACPPCWESFLPFEGARRGRDWLALP